MSCYYLRLHFHATHQINAKFYAAFDGALCILSDGLSDSGDENLARLKAAFQILRCHCERLVLLAAARILARWAWFIRKARLTLSKLKGRS